MATVFDPLQPSSIAMANRLAMRSKKALDQLKFQYTSIFYELWGRPGKERSKEDVQADIDAMGTNAGAMFSASQKTALYILDLDPQWPIPSKLYTTTTNPDGTVTID